MTDAPTTTGHAIAPTRMEWRRDGYRIWCDEDGVHMGTTRDLEQVEAVAMVELYTAIREHYAADGAFPRPAIEPLHDMRSRGSEYIARRIKRAVTDAINDELTPF